MPALKNETYSIADLIDNYRAGRIAVPEFQRGYVWKPNKAPLLLDSIYRNYPISSVLLWESEEKVGVHPRSNKASYSYPIRWLIDGQQRVRTLEKICDGDIRVMFHPDSDRFSLENAAIRRESGWFFVHEILNDQLYRELRSRIHYEVNAAIYERKFEEVRKILAFQVPVICMAGHSFDNAVDAFQRINTAGMRLKAEDVQSAQIAAKHANFISQEIIPFVEWLKREGYGRLNVLHLFRACAFIAKPDARNKTLLHELSTAELRSAWAKTRNATRRVIALLKSELGLLNMDIVWSGNLLIPLIAICHVQNPRERKIPEMIGWMALAALHHRYSSASETALEQDLKACRSSDPIGALLTNLRQSRGGLLAKSSDFSGALADKGGLFAMYVTCHSNGFRDFFGGGKIAYLKDVNLHHILPRALFELTERSNADVLANAAFITESVNKSINMSGPEVYLSKIEKKILDSHYIPSNKDIWRIDNSKLFFEERRKLLADGFNSFLRKSLSGRRVGY